MDNAKVFGNTIAPPTTIHEFSDLPQKKNLPTILFKVRLVRYRNSPLLIDLRQFKNNHRRNDGTVSTGYDSNGLSLNLDQFKELVRRGPELIQKFEEMLNQRS
jgi:hypothetical protein